MAGDGKPGWASIEGQTAINNVITQWGNVNTEMTNYWANMTKLTQKHVWNGTQADHFDGDIFPALNNAFHDFQNKVNGFLHDHASLIKKNIDDWVTAEGDSI